jgi:predicted RNA polymerase sigma factor
VPSSSGTTRLIVLFMCCHPSLTQGSAIRADITCGRWSDYGGNRQRVHGARSDMAQRISRAKRTIKTVGRAVRDAGGRTARRALAAVLQILYLIFNEATRAVSAHACSAPTSPTKRPA